MILMSDVVIFYRKGGNPLDIWGIDSTQEHEGYYTIWFGRRGDRLSNKTVPVNPNLGSRVTEKLDSGYVMLSGFNIDTEKCVLVDIQKGSAELECIPPSLWYKISKKIPRNMLTEYLETTLENLKQHDEHEAKILASTSVYRALLENERNGGVEYQEGPLAILLLFSLRRYVRDKFYLSPKDSDLVQIADDFNELLPMNAYDIDNYLMETCKAWFISKGWMKEGENLIESTKGNGKQHYVSMSALQNLAIAMGCIDAPINLTEIESDIKAAFF